jgi:thioredoxin 1
MDKVAGEFTGKIKFVKVNVDKSPALAQRFGIDGIPALLLFRGGKVTDTMVGLQSEAALKAHLQP